MAEVLVDLFEDVRDLDFAGFVENMKRDRVGVDLLGRPIHWTDDVLHMASSHRLVSGLATTLRRAWIEEMVERGFDFLSLIHPSSVVSKRADIGKGVIVKPMSVVTGFTRLEDHVRVGRGVMIGHHCSIGSYSTLHPGAVISGNCTIGSQVTVGTGVVIRDGTSLGDGAFVGAGAVVTKNVPAGALVLGNPARVKTINFGTK